MLDVLHTFVPELRLRNKLVIQPPNIQILCLVLPFKEVLRMVQHRSELGQCSFGVLNTDQVFDLVIVVLEDFDQEMRAFSLVTFAP